MRSGRLTRVGRGAADRAGIPSRITSDEAGPLREPGGERRRLGSRSDRRQGGEPLAAVDQAKRSVGAVPFLPFAHSATAALRSLVGILALALLVSILTSLVLVLRIVGR